MKNIDGYKLCYNIEVGLREYIISRFNITFPDFDWKDINYPSDKAPNKKLASDKPSLIQHIENMRGFSIEKGFDKNQAHEIHGIYFLLLTDLKILFDQKYKNDLGQEIEAFSLSKDERKNIANILQSVFSIRNKICHMVEINDTELEILDLSQRSINRIIDNFNTFIDQSNLRLEALRKIKSQFSFFAELILIRDEIDCEHDLSNLIKTSGVKVSNDIKEFSTIWNSYISLKNTKGSYTKISNLIEDNRLFLLKIKENGIN